MAIAIVRSFLLVLPSWILSAHRADPGPPLPEDFGGAISPEDSSQVWIEEFFDGPMLLGLIDQTLFGNQELRILNEDVQVASNEVLARQGTYLPVISPGAARGRTDTAATRLWESACATTGCSPGRFSPIRCQNSR